MKLKNISLALGVLAISTMAFGQKKNETSAALERQKAYGFLMKQDYENAKASMLSAKDFVEKAAAHEDTKNSQKTLWLKGDIYLGLVSIAMQSQDMAFLQELDSTIMEDALAALDKGYHMDSKKYKDDIEETVQMNVGSLNGMASMLYEAEQFEPAAEAYDGVAELYSTIDVLDTAIIFNSALCFEKAEKYQEAAERYEKIAKVGYRGTTSAVLASSAYRKAGDFDKAKAVIAEARKSNPTDRELLLESVNTSLAEGDAEGAQSALDAAIATDPNNKQLHYAIGTIYTDLGKNEEAEKAFQKALEIDPDYVEAQYNLGAHLVTWAGDLRTEANQLKLNDPNYDKIIKQSDDTYKRALVPLEKYIQAYPEDKAVLNILFQINKNLKNTEKAMEYKKRMDALQSILT